MGDLSKLEETLRIYTLGVSPAERKKVAQKAARALRQSNADRIRANIDPDGNAFEPRKYPLRSKTGRIRKKTKMFQKLRLFRHLKLKVDGAGEGFEVGFSASDSRIARVHQEGLEDFTSRRKKRRIRYPERKILGFSAEDEEAIMDAVETLFI